ncbi:MAG: hypothetical protein QXJ62_05840 [Nitrososphaeria archaeon]
MKKIVYGVFTLMLLSIFISNIQLVKSETIELAYDDGEADQGDAMVANRTIGWGVVFNHPEVGSSYVLQGVSFYIFTFMDNSAPIRLFIYLQSEVPYYYKKVLELIVDDLKIGWNYVSLIQYSIVVSKNFFIGFNWVHDNNPYLGVDVDTLSHSGSFKTSDVTSFQLYSGFFNYMIRAFLSKTGILISTINIYPQSLNLRSKGKWITAYIELPEGYNVADINVTSIMLNNTIPAKPKPKAVGDYDNDSIPDLMVKFDRAEVISYILANIDLTELIEERFMAITLTINGKLKDGTPFQGSTKIKIIMPMPKCWKFIRTLEIYPI